MTSKKYSLLFSFNKKSAPLQNLHISPAIWLLIRELIGVAVIIGSAALFIQVRGIPNYEVQKIEFCRDEIIVPGIYDSFLKRTAGFFIALSVPPVARTPSTSSGAGAGLSRVYVAGVASL